MEFEVRMRRFLLNRTEDISGVSGSGIVAQGVQFDNEFCALTWLHELTSIAFYQNIEDLEKIHGHNGATKILWID